MISNLSSTTGLKPSYINTCVSTTFVAGSVSSLSRSCALTFSLFYTRAPSLFLSYPSFLVCCHKNEGGNGSVSPYGQPVTSALAYDYMNNEEGMFDALEHYQPHNGDFDLLGK